MSSLRHTEPSVKRCSSSFSSIRNYEHNSRVDRHISGNSKEKKGRKANKHSYWQRSKNDFIETPDSAWIIPHEEKSKNRHNCAKLVPEDYLQTYQRGFLKETKASYFTDREYVDADDDEENIIEGIFNDYQPSDDWDFDPLITNPMAMSENGDGRRSRKGFTSNIYSMHSDELALTQDIRYKIPDEKSDRFATSSYGAKPRPKKVCKQTNYSGNDFTLAEDIRSILHDDIPRPANESNRYSSIPRPKNNSFLRNTVNSYDLAQTEDSIPVDQSKTLLFSGCGAIPRPKKKDSRRKPNFTDDLMLSRDIDQILQEEVGDFDSTAKLAAKNGAIPHVKKRALQKPTLAQDGKLSKDIEYILSDDIVSKNSSNGSALGLQKKNLTKKQQNDDDTKSAKNMDTIIEEEVIEVDPSFATKALKSGGLLRLQRQIFRKGNNNRDTLAAVKTYYASNEAMPSKSIPGPRAQAQKTLPRNKKLQRHSDDIMLNKAIEEILEIPVICSDISLDQKTNTVPSGGSTEHKSKQGSLPEAKSNPLPRKKSVTSVDSRGTDHKKPEDYTIEELIAELFPELLADVLPSDVPNASNSSCSVQLNRDSVSSVTNADALRPMAAGSSKAASNRTTSNRTCTEKWTSGVIYTDEELKLMAEIEREYGIRGH